MKSLAPSRMAVTAMAMSPCPVIRMIGVSMPLAVSMRCRSTPDLPGRRTSLTMQADDLAWGLARKASADLKPVTAKPRLCSSRRSEFEHGLVVLDESDRHALSLPAAARGSVNDTEAPNEPLSIDSVPPCASTIDRASERPRPNPSGLVVVNGAAARSATPGSKPGPLSRTSMATASPSREPRHHDAAIVPPGIAERLGGVAQQIDQHLLDLHGVDADRRQIARDAHLHLDALPVELRAAIGDGGVDQVADLRRARFAMAQANEVAQPPHDLGRAIDLRNDPLGGFGGRRDARSIAGDARVVGDGSERLVDLVRQGGRELAHAAEPEGAIERLLVDAQLLLRALLLADQNADREAGQGEHHHERLVGCHVGGRVLGEVDGGDQSDLGQQQADRHPFQPEPHRGPDHRQEEQVEELEAKRRRQIRTRQTSRSPPGSAGQRPPTRAATRRRRVMSTSRNGVSTATPIMSPTQKRSAALPNSAAGSRPNATSIST